MKFLAIETSSLACSVALQVDEEVSERHAEQAREHTRLVVPMITELMTDADLDFGALDAIVLGNGPGSFIGLRIAASVAQGIAFASQLPVIPVSSMLAVATEALASADEDTAIVTADAHMNEVYLGRFRRSDVGQILAVGEEQLHAIAPVTAMAGVDEQKWLAAGSGWLRYPELWDLNQSRASARSSVIYPRARHLLTEASRLFASGAVIDAAEIEPTYLRQQVATPKPTP